MYTSSAIVYAFGWWAEPNDHTLHVFKLESEDPALFTDIPWGGAKDDSLTGLAHSTVSDEQIGSCKPCPEPQPAAQPQPTAQSQIATPQAPLCFGPKQ